MSLAATQRGLRDLLRSGTTPQASDYLATVAGSERLSLQREITIWWRLLGIERSCPLVSALLKQRGRFDEAVSRFVADHAISPYVERLAEAFVGSMRSDDDPLVATLASFEHGLRRVRSGEPTELVVPWPVHPYAAMAALLAGEPLDEAAIGGRYVTVLSASIPGHFVVHAAAPTTKEMADA